jgi:hypothetical protein
MKPKRPCESVPGSALVLIEPINSRMPTRKLPRNGFEEIRSGGIQAAQPFLERDFGPATKISIDLITRLDDGAKLAPEIKKEDSAMSISLRQLEAYIKCPTKCWLMSRQEPITDSGHAQWVQAQNEAYLVSGVRRLLSTTTGLAEMRSCC